MALVKLFRLRLASGPKADPNVIYVELEDQPKILDRRSVIRCLGKELREPLDIAVCDTSYLLDRIQEKLTELGFSAYVVEDRVSASALIRIHDLRDRIERGEIDAAEDMIRASQGMDELKKAVKKEHKVPLKLITGIAAVVAFISVVGLIFDQLTRPGDKSDWESKTMSMAIEGGGFGGGGGGNILEIGLDSGEGGDGGEMDDDDDFAGGGGGGGGGALGMNRGKGGKAGRRVRIDAGGGGAMTAEEKRSVVMTILLCVAAGVLGLMLALFLGQSLVGMKPGRRKKALVTCAAVGALFLISGGVTYAFARSAANAKVEALRNKIMAKRQNLIDEEKKKYDEQLRRAAAKKTKKADKKKKPKDGKPVSQLGPFASFIKGLPEVQKEEAKATEFDRELLPFTAMMDKMRHQRRAMVSEDGLDGEDAVEGGGMDLAVDTVAEKADEAKATAPESDGPGESTGSGTEDAGAVAVAAEDAGAVVASEADAGVKPADPGEPTDKVASGAAPGKISGGAGGAAPKPNKPTLPKQAQKGLKGKVSGKEVIRLKGTAKGGGQKEAAAPKPPPVEKPKFRLPPMPEIRRPPDKVGPLALAGMSFSGGFISGILLFLLALFRAPKEKDIFQEVSS